MSDQTQILSSLRDKIDKCDHEIIKNLVERYKIVEEVGNYKLQNRTSKLNLYFNIRREISMIEDLANKSDLPSDLIHNLWRAIISNANRQEQQIRFIYSNQYEYSIICKYYPAFNNTLPTTADHIEQITNANDAILGVFEITNNTTWWYDLFIKNQAKQDNLQIFNIVDNCAFVGYIDTDVLCANYTLYITKNNTNTKGSILLSSYLEYNLIASTDSDIDNNFVKKVGHIYRVN